MSKSFSVPVGAIRVESEVKKSRFIALAAYAPDRATAMLLLAEEKRAYPDARHHCWAYLIGNPLSPALVAFSDDGEPGGTAGRPILNVLQHKAVGDIMVIVTRYFGGVKLGAGGLVRAYSQATQLAMENVTTGVRRALVQRIVRGNFALEQPLRHWLEGHDGEWVETEYGQSVDFTVALEVDQLPELERFAQALGAKVVSSSVLDGS